MSFQPVVQGAGLAGWQFLQRTQESQFRAFSASPALERDTDYFTKTIGNMRTAADLVADRRLLSVALGAFGLHGDLDNTYFVRKILEDGTRSDDALANRLSDNRYKKFSAAFGFGPGENATTGDTRKMAELVEQHRVQSFEIAIGEQDDSMRIALFAQRELAGLAQAEMSEDAKWFTLMGMPPLRSMFETALGLPRAFGQIDIDQQLGVFRDRVSAITGDNGISQFANPDALQRVTNLYLARTQIAQMGGTYSSGATALTLLRAGGT